MTIVPVELRRLLFFRARRPPAPLRSGARQFARSLCWTSKLRNVAAYQSRIVFRLHFAADEVFGQAHTLFSSVAAQFVFRCFRDVNNFALSLFAQFCNFSFSCLRNSFALVFSLSSRLLFDGRYFGIESRQTLLDFLQFCDCRIALLLRAHQLSLDAFAARSERFAEVRFFENENQSSDEDREVDELPKLKTRI